MRTIIADRGKQAVGEIQKKIIQICPLASKRQGLLLTNLAVAFNSSASEDQWKLLAEMQVPPKSMLKDLHNQLDQVAGQVDNDSLKALKKTLDKLRLTSPRVKAEAKV